MNPPPVTLPPLAFTEADAIQAWESWGCNCGPAALAACLGLTPEDVRPHLGDFARRGYMNPTMMGQALASLGRRWMSVRAIADRGVVRIQFGGPWMKPGVPPAAAYRHTHWIAAMVHERAVWVYDVNGGWRTRTDWEAEIIPLLVADNPRRDGTWQPTHRWEVMTR